MGEHLVEELPNKPSFEIIGMRKKSFDKFYEYYQKGILWDVVITAGSKSFKCHRVVLASSSPYFEAMFTNFCEREQSTVTIEEIDEDVLETLIQFSYTGKVNLSASNVQDLLQASSVLQYDSLAQVCGQYMICELDFSNCFGMLQLAYNVGQNKLLETTKHFVKDFFKDVIKEEEFLSISDKLLSELISSSDIFVENEFMVYKALMSWIKHDVENREELLPNLLAKVRLSCLRYDEILRYVESEPLIRKSMECRDLVDDAKLQKYGSTRLMSYNVTYDERTKPRKSYSGMIFCVGGRGSNDEPIASVEFYSPFFNKWVRMSDMSTPRRLVGCISLKGKIYAVGGHDGRSHLATVEVFQPLTNKWYTLAEMSLPRRGLGLCTLNGPIYAVGGFNDECFYNRVERYDVTQNKWCPVQSMNCARGAVTVVALKGHMYALGGNSQMETLNTCEKYNPHLDQWTFIAPMNTPRHCAGAVVLDGYIYVIGGFCKNEPLNTVEKYDPIKDKWTYVSSMSSHRGGVGAAVMGREIYAIGGHNKDNFLKTIEIYDLATDRWRPGLDLNDCRAGAGVTWVESGAESLKIIYEVSTKDLENVPEVLLPDNDDDYYDSSD